MGAARIDQRRRDDVEALPAPSLSPSLSSSRRRSSSDAGGGRTAVDNDPGLGFSALASADAAMMAAGEGIWNAGFLPTAQKKFCN